MREQNCWPWRRSPIVAVPRERSAMCVVDTHEVRSSSAHFAAGHNQTSEWPSIRVPVNIAANELAIFCNTRKRNDVEFAVARMSIAKSRTMTPSTIATFLMERVTLETVCETRHDCR